jgi:glutamate synthase domain-containing protein 3
MEGLTDELEKDFRHLLSCIDFNGYDPFSKDFMRAGLVGQMWFILKSLESDVEEEMEGAKKYLSIYKETGDVSFKEMANDELRHAGILIKKHLSETSDPAKKENLHSWETQRQEMLKNVSMTTIPIK